MIKELRELGCLCCESDTNFVFFATEYLANDIANDLLKEGVIIRPCAGWGYKNHLRVTVGTEEQNDIFIKKFSTILDKMKGLTR